MAFLTITAKTTTTTTIHNLRAANSRKFWVLLLFAVALTANACAQIINEATMRQDINNTITTNANKQITGALHRALMQRLITFITGGAAGVTADSLAAANYIPFFKTTGVLDKSNLFLSSGKIGLGTITPAYPLHVVGTASASAYRIGATVFADTNSIDLRLYRRNGKVGIKLGGSNFTNHYENYTHVFRLQDSGEELMRVSYGTGLQLRTYGLVTNIQGGYMISTDTLGSFIPSIFWAKEYAFATDPAAGFPTTRMVIKVNGLVGIGRTSPVYGLDVARSFRADSSAYLATIAASRVGIGNTSASYKLDVTGDLRSTTGAYFATTSGNVGIGTTTADQKLHVFGGGDTRIKLGNETQQWSWAVGQAGAGNLSLVEEGIAVRLLVEASTGRVGIGTTSPATSAALDVTSTTGAVLFPRMTGTQRDALTAANGMVIYNTTTNKLQVRAAGAWVDLH